MRGSMNRGHQMSLMKEIKNPEGLQHQEEEERKSMRRRKKMEKKKDKKNTKKYHDTTINNILHIDLPNFLHARPRSALFGIRHWDGRHLFHL